MKIFVDTGAMDQSAHFGWQNKEEALLGNFIKAYIHESMGKSTYGWT